jgi:site-specific recombinase XerD
VYVGIMGSTRELLPKERRSIKAACALSEFLETGEVKVRRRFNYLHGQIGDIIRQFIASKKPQRINSTTIFQFERNLGRFNYWLAVSNIHTVEDITQRHVLQYIQQLDSSLKGFINLMLSNLRTFLKYLFEKEFIATNIAAAIPNDNYRSHSKLPSYYSEEEIKEVLAHLDRGTAIGKRDYAIFMLAVRLGMRASDIANLRFSNLHWETNLIIFAQCKGGTETKLPLLPSVGNAILDYIRYARPQSKESSVFLAHRSPYHVITSHIVGGVVQRRFRNAHIDLRGRKSGSHALRHSLVKRMLDNQRPISVIAEVLGHRCQESTRHYIRIDMEALRKCALEVPPVAQEFYSQDGNQIFYH